MNLTTRKMAVAPSAPSTLDEQARTVEAVMTTEAPAKVVDWDRWEIVDEILILDGAQYAKQLPLLNSHDRSGVEQVLGSVREIRRDGDALVGTVHFSSVGEADSALTKVREGHLTDFSIGYTVQESVWVPEGQSYALNGKSYDGPVKLSTKFEIRELSICPIGADKLAKARAAANLQPKEEPAMEPKEEGRSPVVAEPQVTVDTAAIRAEAAEAERSRVKDIMSMARKFDVQDLAEKAVTDGTSVAAFQAIVLDALSAKKAPEQPGFQAEVVADGGEKFRAAAMEAVLIRGGRAAGQNDLAALTLRELARECLTRAGHRAPMNVLEMVGRALTSSDLPYILANAANKTLLEAYESADNTWQTWCGVGSIPDFKTLSIVRPSEASDLDEIPESAEYKYGSASDAREQVALVTYGKLFKISRQAVINDDLGAMTDIPAAHGEAAARKVGDVAYAVLTANANMADGVALFHTSSHGNLASSAGAVSVSTLAAGIAAMKKQKDIAGKRRLNIKPQFFIAPVSLEGVCEQLFLSSLEGTQAKPGQVNPYSGNYFVRAYDPRLDDSSTAAWYLAGPKGKTVTVFFLNGNQAPYLEMQQGWNVDGVEYKIRIDAAAKAVDYRALYKNAGA